MLFSRSGRKACIDIAKALLINVINLIYGLRWFLASNLETSAVWVCGVRGAGNLTTLKLTSNGRAPCACGAGGLRDAGSMMVWWHASP